MISLDSYKTWITENDLHSIIITFDTIKIEVPLDLQNL